MHPSSSQLRSPLLVLCLLLTCSPTDKSVAQSRRPPVGGPPAIVVDERLSALRASPNLTGKLIQRLSRGRFVAIRRLKRNPDGVTFYQVNVTRRTKGWIQREAVISPGKSLDDVRLLQLLRASKDFDLIVRARIFLDAFPRSSLRPAVLLLYAEAAEAAAGRLSRDASRRLVSAEMTNGGAPEFSYFLNYNGLDRYNRQGIRFSFDAMSKQFKYDGQAYREIVRQYPRSPEAQEARQRLERAEGRKQKAESRRQ